MEKTEIVCVQQKRKKKNGEKNEEIVRHSLGVDAAGRYDRMMRNERLNVFHVKYIYMYSVKK